MRRIVIAAALLSASCAVAAQAPPMVLPHGQYDVRKATAGTYTLDPAHTAVIARVSHLGFSMSAFRFGKVSATLQWDPVHIDRSKLTATVETSSIATPVMGFAEQLQGADYLNSRKNPTATFVSTAFRAENFRHGKVEGTLTLLGHAVPATFDVILIGAGPGFAASPKLGHVIGIRAVTSVNPKAVGLPAVFNEPIEIAVDTEFTKKD